MNDLDRLRTRAQHAIHVGESWYDDQAALDLIAPKYGTWVRDPRETADAFYIAAADPRVIVALITELEHLRRMREEDLLMIEHERQRGDRLAQGGAEIIADRDRFKADAEHWEKIARSRREHSDAKIAEMQGASILDKAALKKALADVAAIRRALDRLIAGQPPPQHCTEYAMGINHAIGVIDAALAGGRG